MSTQTNVKAKLGIDVFKEAKEFHISIKPNFEMDGRLDRAVMACPAGLYSKSDDGTYAIDVDGCLECGTCLIACGKDVLDWKYPADGAGVQFRCG